MTWRNLDPRERVFVLVRLNLKLCSSGGIRSLKRWFSFVLVYLKLTRFPWPNLKPKGGSLNDMLQIFMMLIWFNFDLLFSSKFGEYICNKFGIYDTHAPTWGKHVENTSKGILGLMIIFVRCYSYWSKSFVVALSTMTFLF